MLLLKTKRPSTSLSGRNIQLSNLISTRLVLRTITHTHKDRQTDRQTDTLKTIPAFSITAGNYYLAEVFIWFTVVWSLNNSPPLHCNHRYNQTHYYCLEIIRDLYNARHTFKCRYISSDTIIIIIILLLICHTIHNRMTSQQCDTNLYCTVVSHACIHAPLVQKCHGVRQAIESNPRFASCIIRIVEKHSLCR